MVSTNEQYSFDFEPSSAEPVRDGATLTYVATGTATDSETGARYGFALERHVERYGGAALPAVSYEVTLTREGGTVPLRRVPPGLRESLISAFKRFLVSNLNAPTPSADITRTLRDGVVMWSFAGRDGPLVYTDLDAAERMLWRHVALKVTDESRREQRKELSDFNRLARTRRLRPVTARGVPQAPEVEALEAIVLAEEAMQIAIEKGDAAAQVKAGAALRKAIAAGKRVIKKTKYRKRKDKVTND